MQEQGKDFTWCYCGKCQYLMHKKISSKFLGFKEKFEPYSLFRLTDKEKKELVENVCLELKNISELDLVKTISPYFGSKKKEEFFSKIGVFIRRLIMNLDVLLNNRIALHLLLEGSIANTYLIRMESHSGDFGNQQLR